MNILAIDTASHLCSAAIFGAQGGRELGRCVRDIGKGHAEQLMDVIGEALEKAGIVYADLGGIAVCIGPGSFTGIRVGVAAARGIALGLRIPSQGVTSLAGLAFEARAAFPGRPVLAALDAKRDELYVAYFDEAGRETIAPRIATLAEAVAMAAEGTVLAGTAGEMILAQSDLAQDIAGRAPTADIGAYARIAAVRGFTRDRPKPLYLRGADAKPQAGFTLAQADR